MGIGRGYLRLLYSRLVSFDIVTYEWYTGLWWYITPQLHLSCTSIEEEKRWERLSIYTTKTSFHLHHHYLFYLPTHSNFSSHTMGRAFATSNTLPHLFGLFQTFAFFDLCQIPL